MEIITADNLSHLFAIIHPQLVLHNTSIGYIQWLFREHVGAITSCSDVTEIHAWINSKLIGDLARFTCAELTDKLAADIEEPKKATLMKKLLIEYLVTEVLGLAGDASTLDKCVLPWDILLIIVADREMAHLLHKEQISPALDNESARVLPVNITIKGESYTHQLNLEFACGLILILSLMDNDISITLFGIKFDMTYMINPATTRFAHDNIYAITVKNMEYKFKSDSFVQGFVTGAEWLKVDHRNYWARLIMYNKDGKAMPLKI